MEKDVLIPLFLVLLMVFGAIGPLYFGGLDTQGDTRLKKFSSYEELVSFLKSNSLGGHYRTYDDWGLRPLSLSGVEGEGVNPTSKSYSTTNIQVEGVDEADVVKTDGEYIYIVSENRVLVVRASPPEDARVLSQIALDGISSEIFVKGDKLVVLGEDSRQTFVKVYDVSDRERPVLMRNASVEGDYFDSRIIGDYFYAVINQLAWLAQDGDEVTLPKICSNDDVTEVSASDIYYSNITDYYYLFSTIVAINVQNDEQEPTYQSFLIGATRKMYVSMHNIYIALPNSTRMEQFGMTRIFERTIIHRIHIQNGKIEYAASGEVPGYVLNQFSMDEHNGYFRIATTTGQVWGWGQATSKNHVYILNLDLGVVGRLEDLAPGEKIYSARFLGNRGYLVTFKKVDPLFVIDLSKPRDPRILGQLKITGYSDYLHPYDETHIIGIGKETVEAEQGDFAWYQGVKISLFDVSDVWRPEELAKYEIGDRGTDSPILTDHKAFLFDRSKDLLVIPVTVAEIDPAKYANGVPPDTYGEFVWDGAYVFQITLGQGLNLKGRITHLDSSVELIKDKTYFNYKYSVKRSLYIGNVLYTISDLKIKMNSLFDLSEINELDLSN